MAIPTTTTTPLQDVNSPAYVNAATTRQAASLQIVRDLAGGTPRMRQCGETYLPSEVGEAPKAYQVRLARSLLFNTFVKVREGLVGIGLRGRKRTPALPIAKGEQPNKSQSDPEGDSDIGFSTDVPLIFRQHAEDIDLAGTHLDVFAKELFRDVVQEGHALILVDMPPTLPQSVTSASPIPDASDEIATKRRPYWVKYKKDHAINWKSDRIDGETVLTKITLKECATIDAGEYGEAEVIRYRVLKLPKLMERTATRGPLYGPMEWALYEMQKVAEKEVAIWIDGDQTSLKRLPIVQIYARRKALLESEPPLIDLAYLNIGHWQQWSDLNCIQRMLVPILHVKGDITGGTTGATGAPGGKELPANQQVTTTLKIGPGAVVQTDKDGDVDYKGADPSATDAMRQSLTDLEARMSTVGLSIIAQKQDREAQITATEKTMDQDERMSELASWLRNLKDGLEMAAHIHSVDYLGLPTGGSFILGFDEPSGTGQQAVTAINAPKGVPVVPQSPQPMMNGGTQ